MNTATELSPTNRVTLTYNGDQMRVEKNSTAGDQKFVYDGQNVFVQNDGSDLAQTVYTLEPNEYGNLVAMRQLQSGIWVPITYQFDGLGSTDSLTDSAQVVTDTYTYQAFGTLKASTGTTTNYFTWVGELGYVRDPETGEYQLHLRQYLPDRARFKSEDPWEFADDSNIFRYVANRPTVDIDPSGKKSLAEAADDYCYNKCSKIPKYKLIGPTRSSCMAKCISDLYANPKEKLFSIWVKAELADLKKTPNWTANLPDCPCHIKRTIRCMLRSGPSYEYSIDPPESNKFDQPHIPTRVGHFHPGACLEIRTKAANAAGAGQQCTYDRNGDLITSGFAAGSPDRVQAVGGFAAAINYIFDREHILIDVSPFELAWELDKPDPPGKHVAEYLKARKPNAGVNCKSNEINGPADPNACKTS